MPEDWQAVFSADVWTWTDQCRTKRKGARVRGVGGYGGGNTIGYWQRFQSLKEWRRRLSEGREEGRITRGADCSSRALLSIGLRCVNCPSCLCSVAFTPTSSIVFNSAGRTLARVGTENGYFDWCGHRRKTRGGHRGQDPPFIMVSHPKKIIVNTNKVLTLCNYAT